MAKSGTATPQRPRTWRECRGGTPGRGEQVTGCLSDPAAVLQQGAESPGLSSTTRGIPEGSAQPLRGASGTASTSARAGRRELPAQRCGSKGVLWRALLDLAAEGRSPGWGPVAGPGALGMQWGARVAHSCWGRRTCSIHLSVISKPAGLALLLPILPSRELGRSQDPVLHSVPWGHPCQSLPTLLTFPPGDNQERDRTGEKQRHRLGGLPKALQLRHSD